MMVFGLKPTKLHYVIHKNSSVDGVFVFTDGYTNTAGCFLLSHLIYAKFS